MPSGAAIVIMAKQPQVGRSKSRLCPPLRPEQAAALAEALLLDTLALVAGLDGVRLAVAITPSEASPYFAGIAPAGTLLLPVAGKHLGDCLSQAMGHLLNLGYSRVLALNADGPSLPPAYLWQVIRALERHDLALGPSQDGGYYTIGMRRLHPALFQNIAWSTSQVLAQTLNIAAASGLSTFLAPPWYDIDTIQDLQRLQASLPALPASSLIHTRRFLKGDLPEIEF